MSIVHVLRQYSDRPVILFTSEELNSSDWRPIYEKYPNVFYAKGSYMNLKHLDSINVQKAYKILILADS